METDEVIRISANTCGPSFDETDNQDQYGPTCCYMNLKNRTCKRPTASAMNCGTSRVRFVRKQEYLTWKLTRP